MPSMKGELTQEIRRELVEDLLLGHASSRAIAKSIGCTNKEVLADIQYLRRVWKEQHAEAFDTYLEHELMTLSALQSAMFPQAMRGDRLAVDRVLSIMDHRARLIGLYAPERKAVAVITQDALMKAVSDWEKSLAEREALLGIDPPRATETGDP